MARRLQAAVPRARRQQPGSQAAGRPTSLTSSLLMPLSRSAQPHWSMLSILSELPSRLATSAASSGPMPPWPLLPAAPPSAPSLLLGTRTLS